jgi:hypothetical protein
MFLTAKVSVSVSASVGVGVGEAMSCKWGSVHKVLRHYLLIVGCWLLRPALLQILSVSSGAKSNNSC